MASADDAHMWQLLMLACRLVASNTPELGASAVGLLLGLGAAHAGTGHASTSTMMFLHIPSRHPQVPAVSIGQPCRTSC